jgi:hypothetical protein
MVCDHACATCFMTAYGERMVSCRMSKPIIRILVHCCSTAESAVARRQCWKIDNLTFVMQLRHVEFRRLEPESVMHWQLLTVYDLHVCVWLEVAEHFRAADTRWPGSDCSRRLGPLKRFCVLFCFCLACTKLGSKGISFARVPGSFVLVKSKTFAAICLPASDTNCSSSGKPTKSCSLGSGSRM